MTATPTPAPKAEVVTPLPRPSSRLERFVRRQGWVVGVALLLGVLVGGGAIAARGAGDER